jgi:hypothetical protein
MTMALAQQVEESLREAESNLRNALAYAARTERPMVTSVIANLINRIDTVITTDELLDKLDNRKSGDSGFFGTFFNKDD